MLVAAVLALGVAAFQILETLNALNLSIRQTLTYRTFTQLSTPPWMWWRSVLLPLYFRIESSPYVAGLVLLLAIVGAIGALRRPRPNFRAMFWIIVALLSFFLMLGGTLKPYKLVYYIPVLNRFRGPSRHSFEWTFALSVLAAYGWDALSSLQWRIPSWFSDKWRSVSAGFLIFASAVIGFLWIANVTPH